MSGLRMAIVLTLCLLPAASARAAVEMTKPLICAAIELSSCVPGAGCRAETIESLDAPRFLSIDVTARTVSGARPQAAEQRTTIHEVRAFGDDVVLNGTEAQLSWNIAIEKNSGDMTLTGVRTVAGDAIVIVVFGACINR